MTNDPRIFVDDWINGKLDLNTLEQHDALRICEQAIVEGHTALIDELTDTMSDSEIAFLEFRKAQMANDLNQSQLYLTKALEYSRNSSSRDHLLEARIRMEWGVLQNTIGQCDEAGIDLKWAMDRLNALSEGHPWHGVSCLNMAEWHRNRGEWGMALAIYSSMSRHGPHMVENIAHSRRRAAEIHIEIDQLSNALRNLWIAHHGFKNAALKDEAIESGLHWLDIALANVSEDNLPMQTIVENAVPRSHDEPKRKLASHPDDIDYMYKWVSDNLESRGGSNRAELHVLADAADILEIEFDLSGVEDKELLARYN